jgi:staphylococcal nuclease domain-containing protein 1
LALQDQAKSEKKGRLGCVNILNIGFLGRWAEDGQSHVRNVTWSIDDVRSLIEKYKQQPQDAIIEQVRDGNSVRAFLIPSFEYVTGNCSLTCNFNPNF